MNSLTPSSLYLESKAARTAEVEEVSDWLRRNASFYDYLDLLGKSVEANTDLLVGILGDVGFGSTSDVVAEGLGKYLDEIRTVPAGVVVVRDSTRESISPTATPVPCSALYVTTWNGSDACLGDVTEMTLEDGEGTEQIAETSLSDGYVYTVVDGIAIVVDIHLASGVTESAISSAVGQLESTTP